MRSLLLLLVAVAAVMPAPAGKNNGNDIIWFPVDGEKGVFVSTKGEIYIESRISNRGRRQRRYSNRHSNDAMYFPYEEDEYSDQISENANHNFHSVHAPPPPPPPPLPHFHDSTHHVHLPPQPFKINDAGVKHPGKNEKHVHHFNEEKGFFSDSTEGHDPKKYTPNHRKHYQEFNSYQPEENRFLQGHHYDVKHYHNPNQNPGRGINFDDVKPVTEIIDEPPNPNPYVPPVARPRGNQASRMAKKQGNLINSNRQQSSNLFKLPNKRGDFTFPDYDEDDFYNPSQVQHHNQFNNFQNNQKPSKPGFPRPTSAPPSWSATASEDFVFPGDTVRNTRPPSTTPKSRQTTVRTECERACVVTTEFNPVCGTDFVTYSNIGRLKCALKCGKDVHFYHFGSCGKSKLATPLQ